MRQTAAGLVRTHAPHIIFTHCYISSCTCCIVSYHLYLFSFLWGYSIQYDDTMPSRQRWRDDYIRMSPLALSGCIVASFFFLFSGYFFFFDDTETTIANGDGIGGWQAIVGVIQHLQVRGQTAKLALYVYFRRVLVGSAIFGVVWAVYGVVRSSEVEEVRDYYNAV